MSKISGITLQRAQRGSVLVATAAGLSIILGMACLAVDGGKIYLTKSELQAASEACTLSATNDLSDVLAAGSNSALTTALKKAEGSGKYIASLHKVGYQKSAIDKSEVFVEFSDQTQATWKSATSTVSSADYGKLSVVRCSVKLSRTELQPVFMQAAGISAGGSTLMAASSKGTLAASQASCALPMALCTTNNTRGTSTSSSNYGFTKGNWYSLGFNDARTAGSDEEFRAYTSSNNNRGFRWVDFYPGDTTGTCSQSGSKETDMWPGESKVACLIRGTGQCKLPAPVASTSSCTVGKRNPTLAAGCLTPIATPGVSIAKLAEVYNSRFGLYRSGSIYNSNNTIPDETGYVYDLETWPTTSSTEKAYNGTYTTSSRVNGNTVTVDHSGENFVSQRLAHAPTQASAASAVTGDFSFSPSDRSMHEAKGGNRRVVVMPIVYSSNSCGSSTSTAKLPVRAYACVLLLDPYESVVRDANNKVTERYEHGDGSTGTSGRAITTQIEFLGLADTADSKCVTTGVAGVLNADGTSGSYGSVVATLLPN